MASDNTPKRTPAMEIKELKATIKDLLKQSEHEKDFHAKKMAEAQDNANELELALKITVEAKQKLRDEIDQLKDDLEEANSDKDSARQACLDALKHLHFVLSQWRKLDSMENDDGE